MLGHAHLALLVVVTLFAGGAALAIDRARDHAVTAAEQESRSARDQVRAALSEGLESLRAREDERTFDVYNYYYTPPNVLAISDPVAVSPLATTSTDRRIDGWFQIEPNRTIRSPSWQEPRPGHTSPSSRPDRIELAAMNAWASPLFPLLQGKAGSLLVERDIDPDGPTPRVRTTRRAPPSEAYAAAETSNVLAQANTLPMVQALDIQQAQAGDPSSLDRAISRGRQNPVAAPRDDTAQNTGTPPVPSRAPTSPPPWMRPAGEPPSRRRGTSSTPRAQPARQDADSPRTGSRLIPVRVQVDYTPMVWFVGPEGWSLLRVVSHGDAALLQGVALNRREMVNWATRIADRVARGQVSITTDDRYAASTRSPTSCERATPQGPPIMACAHPPSAALAAAASTARWQYGLVGTLLVLGFASVAFAERARRRELQLVQAKSRFLGATSHELRTPLTTLRMHAEMLHEGLVSEDRRERVHRDLVTESARLSLLVDNLLEASRMTEGRHRVHKTRVDVGKLVASFVEGQGAFARARGFELQLMDAPKTPLELDLDPQAIERVLQNLLENALKYAAGHEPKRIELAVRADGDAALITVRDHGPGIPEADRARVFERFIRLERPEQAHQPGTGLGLSIVRDLIDGHGGKVTIQNAADGGCILSVRIPLEQGKKMSA